MTSNAFQSAYSFAHVQYGQEAVRIGEKSWRINGYIVMQRRHNVNEVINAILLEYLIDEL